MNTFLSILLYLFTMLGPQQPPCDLTIRHYVTPPTYSRLNQWLYYSVYIRNETQESVMGPFWVYSARTRLACDLHHDIYLEPGEYLSCYGWYYVTQDDITDQEVTDYFTITNGDCEGYSQVTSYWRWPYSTLLPLIRSN